MEPVVSEQAEAKTKTSSAVDRVAIGRFEAEKITAMLKQAQESSKGFMALTKSDIVNFLIREHKAELAVKELTQLRGIHYDPVRHMNWITQELKTALLNGDMAMVAKLQDEIKGIELSVVAHAKGTVTPAATGPTQLSDKPKRKRSKKTDSTHSPEPLPIADLQENIAEG